MFKAALTTQPEPRGAVAQYKATHFYSDESESNVK